MTETAAESDAHLWRAELRSLVRGANLVVLIAAIAAGVWGVFDSMTDADGDRFWGNMIVVAPGAYAGWCMLEITWRRVPSLADVLLRLFSGCLVAPAFVVIPVSVIQLIAVAFPGVRETIAAAQQSNGGFHYYWDEGIAQQLFLVPLGGYAIGACIPLGVALIIALPVLSLRAPQVVAAGSHIEKVDGPRRVSTTAFVFCGLGATTLGIVLWQFGDGDSITRFPRELGRFLNALSQGYFDGEGAMWLSGVVFVVIGVALMAWGCVRVMFARGRAASQ